MENGTQMTLEQWMPDACPKQIVGAQDSHVKIFQLQANNSVLTETEAACFLKSSGLSRNPKKKIDLNGYSLKMLKTFYQSIVDGILPEFSLQWMKSGMTQNGGVLNSKDFGVPQNRERIFIVGHLRGRSGREVFPITRTTSKNSIEQIGRLGNANRDNPNRYRVYDSEGLAPTIGKMDGGGLQPHIQIWGYTSDRKINQRNRILKVCVNEEVQFRIRKLTPKECFRLQGWTDDYFEKAQFVNSDSQLYKQAGNGVTVNVIKAIAEKF